MAPRVRLGDIASHVPEPPQRRTQPQSLLCLPVVLEPAERLRAGCRAPPPAGRTRRPAAAPQLRRRLFCQRQVVRRVARSTQLARLPLAPAAPRVLAQRLQQAVARRPPSPLRRPPPATCPPGAPAGRSTPPRDPRAGADGLGRLQRAAAGEDRQPLEEHPLGRASAGRSSSRASPAASAAARAASRAPPDEHRQAAASRGQQRPRRQHPHRAAASSMARGSPSRRRQSSATAGAFWSLRAKSGRTAARAFDEERHGLAPRERRQLRRVAGSTGSGRRSGGTGCSCSPVSRSASRLVASTASPGHAAQQGRDQPARRRRRCSQLSSTSSRRLARSASVSPARSGRPGASRTPTAAATAWGTSPGSRSAASAASRTPSG